MSIEKVANSCFIRASYPIYMLKRRDTVLQCNSFPDAKNAFLRILLTYKNKPECLYLYVFRRTDEGKIEEVVHIINGVLHPKTGLWNNRSFELK